MHSALQSNARDPEQLQYSARALEQLEAEALDRDRRQFGDAEGRRFVWELIADCGVFRALAGGEPFDPYRLGCAEGQRRIGLRLLARLGAHPELYRQAQAEADKRDREAERELEARAKKQAGRGRTDVLEDTDRAP